MKNTFFLLIFFSTSVLAQQNLVPNHDFELYNNCPNTNSCVAVCDSPQTFLLNWFNPCQYDFIVSADYYNKCCTTNIEASVPQNKFGSQLPYSGNGYIGFIVNFISGITEGIECKLNSKLAKDHCYKVSMYISLANFKNAIDTLLFQNYCSAAITNKHLKIKFSDTLFYDNDWFIYHPTYDNAICIDTTKYYDDSNSWMKLSGLYNARGSELYLILGQVGAYDSLPRKIISNSINLNHTDNVLFSYYYFDDVSVIDATNFITGDTQICKNGTITLSTTIPFEKYKWSTGDTTRQITIKKSGWYWCTISEGCDAYTDSVYVAEVKIDSLDVAMPNLGADINNCYAEAEYWPKTISINTTTNAIDKIRWSTNAIDDNQPSIAINQAGIYWANIYNYCDSKTDTITVFGCPPKTPNIFAPNVFTPNDDGINDVFSLKTKYVNMQSLTIFDRWGNLVHEDKIYFNWAGFSKGKRSDVGTYYYIIKYTDWDENIVKVYSGDVVLVR